MTDSDVAIPVRQKALSTRLMKRYIVIVASVLLIFFVFSEIRIWNLLREGLQREVETIVNSLAASLEIPLWEYDDEKVRESIAFLTHEPNLISFEVSRPTGHVIERITRTPELQIGFNEFRSTRLIMHETPNHRIIPVGQIDVVFHDQRFLAAQQYRIAFDVLMLVIVSGTLALVTHRSTRHLIGDPLEALRISMERRSREHVRTPVSVSTPDDIGVIIAVYNQMLTAEAATESALHRYQTRLEELVRQRTEELAAAEERSRLILESTGDGIIGTDGDNRITFLNTAACRMLGYGSEELLGFSLFNTLHHSDETGIPYTPETSPLWRTGVRGEPSHACETVLWRRGGYPFFVESTSMPIHKDGRQVGTVASFRDISLRKAAEAELDQARQAADQANRLKSDFLANVSHEIRTPMNAIIGMTHLALKTSLSVRQRGYLTRIETAAGTLLAIINDILDFSKIEANRLDIEHIPFHLEGVLETLSTVISPKAHEKNLEFLIAVRRNVPEYLVGDPLRLGQVLINLTNNAVKFTETGDVILTVAVEEQNAQQVRLRFTVRDTGIGMTADQMGRLFRPFTQADGSTTRRFGGTGLGLAICKQLVELMGGQIQVESESGHGSSFTFSLALGVAAETAEARRTAPSPYLVGLPALVVDDNPKARDVHAEILARLGLRPECAGSGEEALLAWTEAAEAGTPFRVALVDWQMPGMDGLETCRRLREQAAAAPERPPLRTIMVTAFGREDIRGEAEELGVDGYLLKPVSPATLQDLLLSLLAPEAVAQGIPVVPAGRAPSLNRFAGIRVLLVEDNPMNRLVATELLESVGIAVTAVEDGRDALTCLQDGPASPPFDAVLMDVQMPDVDGLTATRLLRADPRFATLPIIAMTAHARTEEQERCRAAGMNAHVSKPISPDLLFAALAQWVREAPGGGAPRPMPTGSESGGSGAIALPALPQLDCEAGVRRTGGNRQLYRTLLERFAPDLATMAAALPDWMTHRPRDAVEHEIHSLRGLAGNLGATEIAGACERLEDALRHATGDENNRAQTLAGIAGAFAAALKQELAATQPTAAPLPPVPALTPALLESTRPLMHALALQLTACDGEAVDTFEEIRQNLAGATEARPLLEALDAALAGFDFEAAQRSLESLLRLLALPESPATHSAAGADPA